MDTKAVVKMDRQTSGLDSKPNSLRIPKLKRQQRHISLSDIIAATIGDDARSGDIGYEDFEQDELLSHTGELTHGTLLENFIKGDSDNFQACPNSNDNVFDLDSTIHEKFISQDGDGNFDFVQSLFFENSNNAVDPCDKNKPFQFGTQCVLNDIKEESCSNQSQSSQCLFQVPDNASTQDSNTTESFFKDSVTQSLDTPQKLDFSDVQFDFDATVGFHSSYEGVTETMTSLSNLCGLTDTDTPTSSLQVVPEQGQTTNNNNASNELPTNTSYDSDLEDSVHFVEPDENASTIPHNPLKHFGTAESEESFPPRKRRRSEIGLRTMNQSEFDLDMCDLSSAYQLQQCQSKGIHRARSFSGNLPHRNASRYSTLSNLNSLKNIKSPMFSRTRSFSGSAQYDCYSPIDEERFNTSLNSILGSPSDNNSLSENPFFDDLKSTLFQDCVSADCPQTLFETLSSGPKNDVYARERNLLSKFSTLQAKYPDEIKEISAFYRTQSAEVETERIRELHDDNLPTSFRNHLNQYYDDMLHMIMERVERSLQLLTVAKREIVTANRSSMRPRPLLSRKAVAMMEEWYTRNYEHPYPSQTAVEALAKAGEINPEQVKKWFANKRNRSKNTLHITEVANKKRKRQFSSRW